MGLFYGVFCELIEGGKSYEGEGRLEKRKKEALIAKRVKRECFLSVCLNAGSCLGVLARPGCGPCLVWYFVCLKQSLALEVRTVFANSK